MAKTNLDAVIDFQRKADTRLFAVHPCFILASIVPKSQVLHEHRPDCFLECPVPRFILLRSHLLLEVDTSRLQFLQRSLLDQTNSVDTFLRNFIPLAASELHLLKGLRIECGKEDFKGRFGDLELSGGDLKSRLLAVVLSKLNLLLSDFDFQLLVFLS